MGIDEPNGVLFGLDKIPDLTLTKYSSLGNSGTEEVLGKHNGFLRQFSRKPDTSLHLLYAYNPNNPDGSRLHIYLIVRSTGLSGSNPLGNARQLVDSSPLAPFFRDLKMIRINADGEAEFVKNSAGEDAIYGMSKIADILATEDETGSLNRSLPFCSALVKSTKFVVPTPPHPEASNGYYVQPEFTESEESRLYSMMKLMEALDKPVVYRVDLYPSKHSEEIRGDLPLNIIKGKRDSGGIGRNYELEGIEKSYEKLLEKLDGSPLFNTNIFVFSEDEETGRALLEAAASEAIEKGSCDIAHFQGDFCPTSFLTQELWSSRMEDIAGRFIASQHQDPIGHPGYYIVDSKAMNFRHSYIATQFTLEEASAFFRLPVLEDGEFIQRQKETAPKIFNPNKGKSKALYLGVDNNNQSVFFEESLLKKHAFISGVPGSGKTVTMCHLATSLIRDDIPFLVLEPAKSEYRAILNDPECIKKVCLFAPGANTPFPLRINPFEMPIGVSVGHHINRLCQVFEGAFPLEGALPFLLDRAIESVYAQKGWYPKMKRTGKEDLEFPTLSMLYDQIQKELDKESYDGEVGGNLKSAIHMRIGGLLRRELGDIFDVPLSTIEPSDWLSLSSIIELESLGASQSNFLTLLLCVLIRESLMVSPGYEGDIRHVIFIEEAHNLIGPEANVVTGEHADPKMAATAFISDMLREVRALGEGIIIADQLPSAIAPEVLKNTGLKIALRITSADDRELLGSMMTASPVQLENVAVATPGRALVMYEGLQKPFVVQMTEWLNDPKVDGYIENEASRSIAAKPADNQNLKTKIQEVLHDCEDGGWYRKIGALTAWIDLLSVSSTADALCSRIANVTDEIIANNNLDVSHEASRRKSGGAAAFIDGIAALDNQDSNLESIVRAHGFSGPYEITLDSVATIQNLDSKTFNWVEVIPEFSEGVPNGSDMVRFYADNRLESAQSLPWQIAYIYVDIWSKVRQCKHAADEALGHGDHIDDLKESLAKLETIEKRIKEDFDLCWTRSQWMSLRKLV